MLEVLGSTGESWGEELEAWFRFPVDDLSVTLDLTPGSRSPVEPSRGLSRPGIRLGTGTGAKRQELKSRGLSKPEDLEVWGFRGLSEQSPSRTHSRPLPGLVRLEV